jgi:hypothetical protein
LIESRRIKLSSAHVASSKKRKTNTAYLAAMNKVKTMRGGASAGGWNPSKISDPYIKAEGE